MQIVNSSWTGGVGVAHGPRLGRRNERQQEQGGGQGEKLSGSTSSPGQPSGSAIGKARVIMGSGGDSAILSQEGPAATAQADKGQKAVIENINRPGVSGETKATVADLQASAENVRQREAELDADFAKNVRSLAQSFNSKNALNSTSEVEKSADDSETIIDQMRQDKEQATVNTNQAVTLDPADGKQTELTKDVTQTEKSEKSEYPAPTADNAGHVDGYL